MLILRDLVYSYAEEIDVFFFGGDDVKNSVCRYVTIVFMRTLPSWTVGSYGRYIQVVGTLFVGILSAHSQVLIKVYITNPGEFLQNPLVFGYTWNVAVTSRLIHCGLPKVDHVDLSYV